MLENFEAYLIQEGYSQETPVGNPSTAYDYRKRINQICEREGVSPEDLALNIDDYVRKYDTHGEEAEFGASSHRANINALRRFNEFINIQN
ncbi:MAG TPA: hypothetical protein VL021_02155 [Brumimicrobium sp.]|nr:hypothetical protein [Brumimicrobium sp.]